jgi:ferredoxin-NADP reductase
MPSGPWQPATVTAVLDETRTAKTFRFRLPQPQVYLPGQHYILRLSAPDGYSATRSYSVASAPGGTAEIDLTIERLPGGEVSVFMHDEVRVGDEVELRGPIGRWFVWEADRLALLIGGGAGVVPLMSMLRYARQRGVAGLLRLVVSVRTPEDLYYRHELPGPEVAIVYTRAAPPGDGRPPGRLAPQDLEPLVREGAAVYICGSSPFADAASDAAMANGVPANQIRVERFGPTG